MAEMNLADTKQFLETVITTPEGWLCISAGTGLGEWFEEWFHWPEQVDQALERANVLKNTYNVYFSAHLFREKSTRKENVLPSRTIQADIDEGKLATVPLTPSVLVQTSTGRYQAYWLLEQEVDVTDLEAYSRNLTYSIVDADRSGWSLGHRMRLPGTINYKRQPLLEPVKLEILTQRKFTQNQMEVLPDLATYKLRFERYDTGWLDSVHAIELKEGPLSILERVRTKLPARVYTNYGVVASDRSVELWALMCAAFRAELTRDEVFWLAKHSANNKFKDLKYHQDLELGKDVLRAEEAVKIITSDAKQRINRARRTPGSASERRQAIAKIALDRLLELGSVIHCDDDTCWYIREDIGRPIPITPRNDYLKALLLTELGLNEVETEQRYVINELHAYALGLPETGTISTMSHLDLPSRTLLLHTGRQTVLRITGNEVLETKSGLNGVVFPWPLGVETFKPAPSDVDWAEVLIRPSVKLVMDLEPNQAYALLKVWTLFILLRNACPSRPIMALLGQPGSGKSTLFKKVYTLLYGRNRALNSVTNREDFDYAVATDCLVVLDNLDTYESWLPDRLALSAGSSDRVKRKLYTDSDTVVIKRQAVLGVTAHNPQFGREDVADRLLIVTLQRLPKWEPEAVIINEIAQNRNLLWGSLIKDLQQILRTPLPTTYPQFRIEDFARIGAWIAEGVGCLNDFSDALKATRGSQRQFVLDEDQILVEALMRYLNKRGEAEPKWETASTLWSQLEALSPDPVGFSRRYRSAVSLGKKLWAFMEPLKAIVNIEHMRDDDRGSRLWRFSRVQE